MTHANSAAQSRSPRRACVLRGRLLTGSSPSSFLRAPSRLCVPPPQVERMVQRANGLEVTPASGAAAVDVSADTEEEEEARLMAQLEAVRAKKRAAAAAATGA